MGIENHFSGTGVALVTPFLQNGGIDFDGLSRLVNYVTQGGIDYLVVLGTTAESATLNNEEQHQILRFVAEENAGKLPLVAGIGGNNTHKVASEMQSKNLTGYDAILSVTPYYNRPTQEGIYQHFSYLSQASPLPLLLYNVPSRTGVNMLPQTVARLARDFSTIIGVKEACGDMNQIQSLLQQVPFGFNVISGDDATALETVRAGGAGVISVLGQALPEVFSTMIRNGQSLNHSKSDDLQLQLTDFMSLIFKEGNPSGIKALLNLLGICGPLVRLPLVPATEALVSELEQAIKQFYSVA